jgi:hypothetical protein
MSGSMLPIGIIRMFSISNPPLGGSVSFFSFQFRFRNGIIIHLVPTGMIILTALPSPAGSEWLLPIHQKSADDHGPQTRDTA